MLLFNETDAAQSVVLRNKELAPGQTATVFGAVTRDRLAGRDECDDPGQRRGGRAYQVARGGSGWFATKAASTPLSICPANLDSPVLPG